MNDRPALLTVRAKKIIKALDGLSIREAEYVLKCVGENLKYCSKVIADKSQLNLDHSEID